MSFVLIAKQVLEYFCANNTSAGEFNRLIDIREAQLPIGHCHFRHMLFLSPLTISELPLTNTSN
jgi:hypothetical protein